MQGFNETFHSHGWTAEFNMEIRQHLECIQISMKNIYLWVTDTNNNILDIAA